MKKDNKTILIILAVVVVGFLMFNGNFNFIGSTIGLCDYDSAITDNINYIVDTTSMEYSQAEPYIINLINEQISDCTELGGAVVYYHSVSEFIYGDNFETNTFNNPDYYNPDVCNVFCEYDGQIIIATELSNYERMRQNKECRDEIQLIINSATPIVEECINLQCERADIFITQCADSLAEVNNDPSICEYGDKGGCYANLARINNDPSICDNLPTGATTANDRRDYSEGCYYLYVNCYDIDSGTTCYASEETCEGTYGKHGPIGLDDCAYILCEKTEGIWTQAGLSCDCSNNAIFNQETGCWNILPTSTTTTPTTTTTSSTTTTIPDEEVCCKITPVIPNPTSSYQRMAKNYCSNALDTVGASKEIVSDVYCTGSDTWDKINPCVWGQNLCESQDACKLGGGCIIGWGIIIIAIIILFVLMNKKK